VIPSRTFRESPTSTVIGPVAGDTSAAGKKGSSVRTGAVRDGPALRWRGKLPCHAEKPPLPMEPLVPQALIASMPALGSRRGGTSRRALRRPDARDPLPWMKEDLDPPDPPGSGDRASYAKPSNDKPEGKAAGPRLRASREPKPNQMPVRPTRPIREPTRGGPGLINLSAPPKTTGAGEWSQRPAAARRIRPHAAGPGYGTTTLRLLPLPDSNPRGDPPLTAQGDCRRFVGRIKGCVQPRSLQVLLSPSRCPPDSRRSAG
jgi:hypothetical protein